MTTRAQFVVHKILEVRQAISPAQLERQIANWYSRQDRSNGIIDARKFGLNIQVFISRDLPDILMTSDGKLSLDLFEKHVLKNSGWKIVRSVERSPDWTLENDYFLTLERSSTYIVPKPRFLYHVTPVHNVDRILRKGILPKKQIYKHLRFPEPRVYLFTAVGVKKADIIFSGEDVTILRIDTKRFDKFNIYHDERMIREAMWTPTHIPSHAIEVIASGNTKEWGYTLLRIDLEEI